jgi:hypothetical protein
MRESLVKPAVVPVYDSIDPLAGTLSTLGFGFALMLWLTAGRQHQEAIAHAG